MSIFDEFHELEGHHCGKCCNLESCHDYADHLEYEVAMWLGDVIEDAERLLGIR
jgi:hypothetical protein